MRRIALALAVGATFVAGPAFAQDEVPPEVKGVKIVVPSARGKASWGAKKLTSALRKAIKKGTGGIVSSKKYARAQRKLKIRGKNKYAPGNAARAGKKVGAQYVLLVDITKKKWVYTAHAVLINTATGEQQMDFRSGYYKPGKDAPDRGRRISKTTLNKIAKLMAEGNGPAMAAADKPKDPPAGSSGPSDAAAMPDELPPPSDDKPTMASNDTSSPSGGSDSMDKIDDSSGSSSSSSDSSGSSGSSDSMDKMDKVDDPPPPPPSGSTASDAPPSDGSDGTAVAEVPVDNSEKNDLIRAALTFGSGLLHTYDLSSDRVASSGLSYRLSPVALFALNAEGIIPDVGVGIFANVGFSPMKFQINVDDTEVATPSGSIFDLGAGANLHVALSGSGRSAYEVIPALGIRVMTLSVSNHQANIALSSSAIAPFVGVGVKLPLTPQLDLTLSFDGGFVVSYSESPDRTASDGGSGFLLGGGLAARFWMTDLFGLALDARFDAYTVGLSGSPNRQVPPDEDLTDPTISTKDLRASLGVAFRL